MAMKVDADLMKDMKAWQEALDHDRKTKAATAEQYEKLRKLYDAMGGLPKMPPGAPVAPHIIRSPTIKFPTVGDALNSVHPMHVGKVARVAVDAQGVVRGLFLVDGTDLTAGQLPQLMTDIMDALIAHAGMTHGDITRLIEREARKKKAKGAT